MNELNLSEPRTMSQVKKSYEWNDDGACPEKYAEGSLEYKMFIELRIWEMMRRPSQSNGNPPDSKTLSFNDTMDIVDNLKYVLTEGTIEIERILGGSKYRLFGKGLLSEMKRIPVNIIKNKLSKVRNNNSNSNKKNIIIIITIATMSIIPTITHHIFIQGIIVMIQQNL